MYSVCVIDNEPFTALWLEQVFHRPDLGFTCVSRFSGAEEAAQAILVSPPDLIVSDIRMPGMNGLEFMKFLIERQVPSAVILVSAYSDFAYAQEALRMGALDYLIKPVSKEEAEKCCLRIEKILQERLTSKESSDVETDPETAQSIMVQMKQYLNQNYMKPVHLRDLADYVHLNESYCSVLFKKHFGVSFSQYLIALRMEKAKKLLQSGAYSVSQVGEMVGYSDLSYFSKEFKKRYGVAPMRIKAGREADI